MGTMCYYRVPIVLLSRGPMLIKSEHGALASLITAYRT